jgi:ABC-type nitrate/sulfonate/bicarbonate transport system substrate-binding protein
MQTRRGFLTAMSAAGALGLFSAPRVLAAEGPLETTSVRLFKSSLICSAAPQFAAEGLLRAEGFKEIAYVDVPRTEIPQAFSDGRVDFTVTFAINHIQAIDRVRRLRSLPACMRAATSCSPAKASVASLS